MSVPAPSVRPWWGCVPFAELLLSTRGPGTALFLGFTWNGEGAQCVRAPQSLPGPQRETCHRDFSGGAAHPRQGSSDLRGWLGRESIGTQATRGTWEPGYLAARSLGVFTCRRSTTAPSSCCCWEGRLPRSMPSAWCVVSVAGPQTGVLALPRA